MATTVLAAQAGASTPTRHFPGRHTCPGVTSDVERAGGWEARRGCEPCVRGGDGSSGGSHHPGHPSVGPAQRVIRTAMQGALLPVGK
eukprot:2675910-Pleurochrysis_carterae.AAC.1